MERGDVRWGPAPHKDSPAYRPWVIISNTSHPFSHTESIALAMTTRDHEGGITVPDGAWVRGGSEKQSYISPWYVATIKYRDFDRHQGSLRTHLVDNAVERMHSYTVTEPE